MAACAYRSLEPVLQERIAALQEHRSQDALRVDATRRVAHRRMGRAWGGTVALAFALAAFVAGLSSLPASYPEERWLRSLAPTLVLGAPVAGLVALVCGRLFARAWLVWKLDAPLRL